MLRVVATIPVGSVAGIDVQMVKGDRVANEGLEAGEGLDPCARRRGRPLDAGREEAILGATVKLLGERGFDRFTVQDIADRAGVGLGSIYRRWPTKLDAVMAAVRLLDEVSPITPPSGDVEGDLARALSAITRDLAGCIGSIIPGLVSAKRDDPDLARVLRETAVTPRLDMFRQILAPAFPDPVERDLRAEMAVAIPLYRFLFAGKLPSEREIRAKLVPLILGQSVTAPRQPAKRALARRAGQARGKVRAS
jgi:AcrR family transcriptional regulator